MKKYITNLSVTGILATIVFLGSSAFADVCQNIRDLKLDTYNEDVLNITQSVWDELKATYGEGLDGVAIGFCDKDWRVKVSAGIQPDRFTSTGCGLAITFSTFETLQNFAQSQPSTTRTFTLKDGRTAELPICADGQGFRI